MSKLCTLKAMEPGSVVVLPEKLGLKDKFGMVLGTEYTKVPDSEQVFAQVVTSSSLAVHETSALADSEEWEIVQNEAITDAIRKSFEARQFSTPYVGLTMGSDPEVFAFGADGRVIPAWDYLPCEKEAIGHLTSAGSRVPAYWDGVQAEFAPSASQCVQTHADTIRLGLMEVLRRARLVDLNAKLKVQNVVEVGDDILKGASDEHIAFRCTRSYNVYSDEVPIPDARTYKYRCAGGHIHFGFANKFTAPCIEHIVRGLDGVLGIAGVSLAAGVDNPERRKAYGRAGEFRLPKHGLEYRVLSNFWLGHPAMTLMVLDLARQALAFAESGLYQVCWEAKPEQVQEIINSCNVVGARKLLAHNQHALHALFSKAWPIKHNRSAEDATKMRELAVKTLVEGPHVTFDDATDIETNWKLDGVGWEQFCFGKGDTWQSLTSTR